MTVLTGVTTRKVQIVKQNQFERFAFMFMRLSGVALLFLAVGHMMIQHVLSNSSSLTIQFVRDQWQSWGWRAYDLLLLAFAIAHGLNGLNNILGDYIHNPKTMQIVKRVLFVFMVITIIWSAVAITTFNPAAVSN